ncbi:hypothetical protein DBB36_14230 [Flavobacterium sp. WLB]|uniref:hypothetical protein n=1 Tax=unclassified Flavobacterium TaxID=196869 RepID=UPI0006ABD6C5|nr:MULTISPECIES: hypothetical protein [unclassified Flavobacterium]KOP40284.1 hypothetical protein AKO67_01220 [Flavobacterium sp. VMW]OWU91327.1 hypothetical protein APR43_07660 [Flavobacterium sp. NLM]PUU69319.1 hypothetical protein DBB36_14230 [Flavobacterium sp. WLB]
MTIKYLQQLRDNPISYSKNNKELQFKIEGIPESEIQQLELTWNNGNLFPQVLKELLFLAGNFCYVCDYGPNDSQQEMQEWVREHLEDSNRSINRPFYAFDVWGGLNFLFIYLDEGDNPNVFQALPYCDDDDWIIPLTKTIQNIIEIGINRVKIGQNPY